MKTSLMIAQTKKKLFSLNPNEEPRYCNIKDKDTGEHTPPSMGCGAFVCLNSDDEIIMTNETHSHPKPARLERVDDKQDDVAVVITSRKGKELLLFRQFTYRKQYFKHNKARWVCSNDKNCRGVIFTDSDNVVTSAFEEHCHPPPKYYLKADNVIGALREPLVFESD
ncbi:hypothetical protein evm_005193 [Chilo suppressalis]|nr:hypothetical protein evm_005193 [Chilo suppressalis]